MYRHSVVFNASCKYLSKIDNVNCSESETITQVHQGDKHTINGLHHFIVLGKHQGLDSCVDTMLGSDPMLAYHINTEFS